MSDGDGDYHVDLSSFETLLNMVQVVRSSENSNQDLCYSFKHKACFWAGLKVSHDKLEITRGLASHFL